MSCQRAPSEVCALQSFMKQGSGITLLSPDTFHAAFGCPNFSLPFFYCNLQATGRGGPVLASYSHGQDFGLSDLLGLLLIPMIPMSCEGRNTRGCGESDEAAHRHPTRCKAAFVPSEGKRFHCKGKKATSNNTQLRSIKVCGLKKNKTKNNNKKHLWQRRTCLTLPTKLFRGYLLAAQFLPTEENR